MALDARALLFICSTSACWAFSFGLGSQIVTHWLHAQGASDTAIGLSHSFYYFGVAVASCAVPSMMRRVGPTGCATLGMIFSGLTLALFPWGGDEFSWYLLRFLNGLAGAMCLVPLETLVSRASRADLRTQNFACYGVSLTLGGACGIGIGLYLYEPGSTLAFYLGGCVPFAASFLLYGGMCQQKFSAGDEAQPVALNWGRNFLSYGTAWCQGFLEGGMLAFLSLFLIKSRGYAESAAGTLMSVTMIGVILFQVPVGWLADRYGKTPMLLSCYGVVAIGLAAIPWLPGPLALAVGLFAFGACTGAMYPLGLSLLGEGIPAAGLARAYAWYLAIECVGSQAGAAAMGMARDRWGPAAMFPVGFVVVAAVLATWLAMRWLQRPSLGGLLSLTGRSTQRAA